MAFLNRFAGKTSVRRGAVVAVEVLESKALLATSTASIATGFNAPDLGPYIARNLNNHENTGPAVIRTMETALQSQLTNGVLTALQGGTLTQADFQTSVANVVTNYETNVDQQLLPRFKNIDAILKGQARSVLAVGSALNLQQTEGLITSAQYTTEAGQAINAITGGPLYPLNSANSGFASATSTLETQLKLLPPALATGATPSLTLAQAQAVAVADAEAYRVPVGAALFGHNHVNGRVNTALNTFESSVNAITSTGTTLPAQQLTAAITALDAALLDSNGLFGPNGPHRKAR